MEHNMGSIADRKNGISLTVERGGWAGRRELNAHEWFERQYRTWCARGKVNGCGPYASRAVADTAQGIRFPQRINPDRIVTDALDGGATVEWARQLPPIIDQFIVRLAREKGLTVDTGPTAPADALKRTA
jgi:hypothetical protein